MAAELTQDWHHIAPVKAKHKASPDLRGEETGPSLERSFKVTFQRDTDIGR